MRSAVLLATAVLVPMLVACVVGHDDSSDSSNDSPPGDPSQNVQPITVVVDTNQTMSNVVGGQGVGVFVQYSAGGHWRVRWTCDTQISGAPCDFVLKMDGTTLANGTSKFDSSETNDSLVSSDSGGLVASSHTTNGVDEVDFDAAPGADVKIDLSVSGLRDGAFFFFVQNGQVDGNFPASKLTDPLVFEPSTP